MFGKIKSIIIVKVFQFLNKFQKKTEKNDHLMVNHFNKQKNRLHQNDF